MSRHCAITDVQSLCGASCVLQHVQQVVPELVHIIAELPQTWTAQQNAPMQTQADFTQLMLDLRRYSLKQQQHLAVAGLKRTQQCNFPALCN